MVKLECFHSTSKENAQAIIRQQRFLHSNRNSCRLGEGAYFFNKMGSSVEYPMMCARELSRFKYSHNDLSSYAILSCIVECEDEQFLDLTDPDTMEAFHHMRYMIHDRSLKANPSFKYNNASFADTLVIEELKRLKPIAVVRAPQFFGMFEKEQRMEFSDKKISQNPRTFVPNVINMCVDTHLAHIRDIKIVERGDFNDGHEGFIG